ncbi:MAG: ROK family protein [Micrococcaceae bacterium]
MQYLAIDIGGTYIKCGLLSQDAQIIQEWKVQTPGTLKDFQTIVGAQIQKYETEVAGIAFSIPGTVYPQSKLMQDGQEIYYLKNLPLKTWMKTLTTKPWSMIDDGNAVALAENWKGNLHQVAHGAAVVLGTGVSSGLIINHELYQGSNLQAGETGLLFASLSVTKTPATTYAQLCSAVQFMSHATQLLNTDSNDSVTVFAALAQGNHHELTELFRNYCKDIARLLATLQIILDVEKIVLGGGISQQQLLIEEVKKQYSLLWEEETFGMMLSHVDIEACFFASSAQLVGALRYLLIQHFNEQ